jgi:electron transfer flavoprotein alpha subunit
MDELKPMTYEELTDEFRNQGVENASLRAKVADAEKREDRLVIRLKEYEEAQEAADKHAEVYAEDQHIIEDLKKKLTKAERVVTFARFLQTKEMSASDLLDAQMKLAKAVEEYDVPRKEGRES